MEQKKTAFCLTKVCCPLFGLVYTVTFKTCYLFAERQKIKLEKNIHSHHRANINSMLKCRAFLYHTINRIVFITIFQSEGGGQRQ